MVDDDDVVHTIFGPIPKPEPILACHVVKDLASTFEEKVLNQDCARRELKWAPYLTSILGGWCPTTLDCTRLDSYLQAVIFLQSQDEKTTGMALVEEGQCKKVIRAVPTCYKGGKERKINVCELVVVFKEGFEAQYGTVIGLTEGNDVLDYVVKIDGKSVRVNTDELRPVYDP